MLALDHGGARCGCAVSDPSGTIVQPLGAIPPDPERVAELVVEREAERVIVGLPVSLGGDEGPQASAAREFAEQIERLIEVPVELYDERLTTRMAQASAREGARGDEDSLAAAHLLESYLAAEGRS